MRILWSMILTGLLLVPLQVAGAEPPASESRLDLFPGRELFEPLVADLGWPRFAASHQWRLGTDEFDRVAAVSFGESIALLRGETDLGRRWEFGFQAMMDASFDATRPSRDLSNEDYFAAITASVEVGRFTTQFRVSHLSSHLGDEYIQATGSRRTKVSLERVDVLTSFAPIQSMRLYGGGGVWIAPRPEYDPIGLQGGVEWVSPRRFAAGHLRPVLGTDLQLRQENGWIPEVSVVAAMRLSRPADDARHVEAFVSFYHGRSPDGQFFEQTVDLVSLGIRLGI